MFILQTIIRLLVLIIGISLCGAHADVLKERAPTSPLSEVKAIRLAKKFVQDTDYVYFRGQGRSNEPTLYDNSIVIIMPCKIKDVKVDDFVMYVNDDGVRVMHRCVLKENGRIVTKGDNNSEPDSTVITDENLIGAYITQVIFDPAQRLFSNIKPKTF